MTNIDAAMALFDERCEAFLDDLKTFLRFQTISAQPEHKTDMQTCAEWIRDQLASAGLKAEVLPTAGHPAVFADSGPTVRNANAPTILCYGHYDVQPVGDESLWKSPPFEPTLRDGNLFARGSADNKGQCMTHLAAVRSWYATNHPLPVRVKFLIEGEEEIGSPHLPAILEEHRQRLACDYVLISDTSKHDDETPALTRSTRGLVYKHITIDGPARDLHSGQYGGMVANPANTLAKIIASLHDDAHRVTIPGFYDEVLPVTDDLRQELAEAGTTDADVLAATGSPATAGEAGFSTAERNTVRPTLDVNGMVSGYTGEGGATIIPARASAKISMRLAANQDPAKISQAFDDAVRRVCPSTVQLTITTEATCAAYTAPADSPAVQVAIHALTEAYSRPAVVKREGATLPILPLFKEILGADSLMLGFAAPDCNLHSPNEFFGLDDFKKGVRCIIRFLGYMGPS